jgi:hypothetical protein
MAKRVTINVYGQRVKVRPKVAKRIRAGKQHYKQPLLQPMQPLQGQTLEKAAHQITNLQIKPQLSAIDRASSTAVAQGGAQADRLGGYYRQLAQEAQQGIARTAAIGQRTVAGIGATGREEQQQLNSADQMVSGQEQTDQAVRGTGLQFGDRAREELAAAKAAAAQRTGTDETVSTNYSQNFQDIQNAMAGATSMRGGEAQTQLANMLANQQAQYRGQRQDIQSTRGDTYTKNLLDLREKSFEDQSVIQGLLGDQQKLQYQAQTDRQDRQDRFKLAKMSNRHALEMARLQAKLNRQGKLSPKEQARLQLLSSHINPKTLRPFPTKNNGGGSGGSGGLTPAETRARRGDVNKNLDTLDTVSSTAKLLQGKFPQKYNPDTLQGRIALANSLKVKYPGDIVRAAMDVLYDEGHISRDTRAILKRRYPGLYRQLIKTGKAKKPAGQYKPHPARPGGANFSGPHG